MRGHPQRQDLRRGSSEEKAAGDRPVSRPVHAQRSRHLPRPYRQGGGKVPLLGVCLGHQAIGQVYGGKVIRAPEPLHGKLSSIRHTDEGVFKGLPSTFDVTRYHSLIVERGSLPDALEVTAETSDRLDYGVAAQDAAGTWRAVPPREHRLAARACAARQLPFPRRLEPAPPQRAVRARRRLIGHPCPPSS